MHENILSLLRDPFDGSELHLQNAKVKNGQIYSGVLRSNRGKEYPVVRGIPRFLNGVETKEEKQTRMAFAREWKYFDKLDGFMGSGKLFQNFISPLNKNDFRRKCVVECGSVAGVG